jgi:hypothetical protein
MTDAEINDLQLIDENIIEEYENEDDFEISLGANIDDEMLSVEVPDTATSGLVSDRTKFGYSQENEPLGRIALRKYRDRTTENGVL